MQSIRTRQLAADLSYNGTKYSTAKPWDLATGSTVNEAAIATEAYVTTAVSGVTSHTHTDQKCYVDSNRAGETFTETGSEIAPFRTLSAAISTKLADGQTDTVIFVLRPGQYVGVISRDKTTQFEQSFEIRGSGAGNCQIIGSAAWDATIPSVLYFRDFAKIVISGVGIKHGAYGIYTRNTPIVTVENCAFSSLGSNGVNHGFDRTQAQMAADWATQGQTGSSRSDGGVMRIRDSTRVEIRDCEAINTLRGIRLQDCASGRITGCTVRQCLESSFYLAAGTRTGATGCNDFLISNCVSEDAFNNAFLVIGGANNTICGCRSYNTANSAVAGWHTQGLNVSGCVFEKPTQLAYNGIGSLGDSWGGIFLGGDDSLTDTLGYMLTAVGNSILRIGLGRYIESVGFYFGTLDETLTSFRVVIDNNCVDATTKVYKEDSPIPLVNTSELLSMVVQNDADIGTNTGAIAANTTNIAGNDTDIAANVTAIAANTTNIAGNDTDIAANVTAIAGNDTDIAANTTAIATKQATLSWSTVADDNDTNPVTSKDIKSYVDANAGGSGASLGANTFTGTQTVELNGNATVELKHSGSERILQLNAGYGNCSIWVGEGHLDIVGDRVECQATSGFRIPRFSSAPTIGTNNSRFGCLYADTSGGNTACKLYFHNGTEWKEVTLSS